MDRRAFTEEFITRIRECPDVHEEDVAIGRDARAVLDPTYDQQSLDGDRSTAENQATPRTRRGTFENGWRADTVVKRSR